MRYLIPIVCAVLCCSAAAYGATSVAKDEALIQADDLMATGNYGEAIEILLPYAEEGDAEVEFALAFAHMTQAIDEQDANSEKDIDISAAMYWANRAIEHGSAAALNLLSAIYGNGIGVPVDTEKSLEYVQRSAELGDEGALLNIAVMLYTGEGLPRDVELACEKFTQLLDLENPNFVAAYYLGVITFKGECGIEADQKQAVELIRIAADRDYGAAQRDMGQAYEYGWGGVEDMELALQWYERGALNGDPESLWRMGFAYVSGQHRPVDSALAVEYFQAAADLGHVNGMVSMAVMYATGDGIEQDFVAARNLYEEAVEYGSSQALKNLGVMYIRGEGVAIDPVRACLFFEQSVALGNSEAVEARSHYCSTLSREEQTQVEERFDSWLDQFEAD